MALISSVLLDVDWAQEIRKNDDKGSNSPANSAINLISLYHMIVFLIIPEIDDELARMMHFVVLSNGSVFWISTQDPFD